MRFHFLISALLACVIINAQHPYYGALNQQLLSANPAFAGSNKQFRVQAIGGTLDFPKYGYYKDGYYLGADVLIKKHSGIGISAHQEQNGKAYSSTQIDLSYAYHINAGEKWKIVPALQVSVFQLKLNASYLSYEDFNNSGRPGVFAVWEIPTGIITKTNLDFSAGLMIYKKNFFAGASILSFMQPDEGLLGVSKRPLTQVYQVGNRFHIGEQSCIDAYAFLKTQKYRETFLQYGAYLSFRQMVSLHLANRINDISNTDVIIMGANINIHGFKIGYNCNWNYSKNTSNYFFNEVYLSMNFGAKKVDDPGVKLYY